MATFKREELEKITKKKLKRIATYLKLDIPREAMKREIIEAIMDSTSPPLPVEEEPQMSVRIRRIKGVSNVE